MELLVGVLLGLGVLAFAAVVGFDRVRAFYPILLMVIATYYVLFATMEGSPVGLVLEAAIMSAFVTASVAGLRWNLWVVVVGLAGHGLLDALHPRLPIESGAPTWWPPFCMAFDLVAAGWLALRLMPANRPAVARELALADDCETDGRLDEAFVHLERAHVLGQASTIEHVRVHVRMLGWGLRRRDVREVLGQALRIVGAASKTAVGLVPLGNTGGADVSALKPMPIPADLAKEMAATPRPGLSEFVAAAFRKGAADGAEDAPIEICREPTSPLGTAGRYSPRGSNASTIGHGPRPE